MVHKLLVTSLLTLGSILVLLSPVNAQSSNSEVNQIRRDTNEQTGRTNNVTIQNQRSYQRYFNYLAQVCLSGDISACKKYDKLMRAEYERVKKLMNRGY
ncbi:hypothetical protein CAL7716_106440 (plasmid) [Calothrix sp. PCC 7716]|nr:hypothetical protein CAL7716_106440 [Calothrix sp. PCC 7716]